MATKPTRQLFRKSALDRLSSPEQLDRLVPVSDPLGWVALMTLFILLAAATAWGVFGRIPDQVEGKGILVAAGGRIVDAMSPSDGAIIRLHVTENADVEKGQAIAVIEQSGLEDDLLSAKATLAERELERRSIEANFAAEKAMKEKNVALQKKTQERIAEAAERRSEYLASTLENLEGLLAQGYATRLRVEETISEYNSALQDVSAARNQMLQLEAEQLTMQSDHVKEMTRITQRVAEAERAVRELENKLSTNARVLAPASGRVTELKVFEGAVIRQGDAILSIATAGAALQAVLYIPTADGKRVKPGMTVRVSPSTVKKEEFGSLLGTIAAVSNFPATRQGMISILQNEQLVTAYSEEGAPYAARIDFQADPTSSSGLRWTSGAGPNIGVTAGTTLEAEVTVSENPPVNLIIPFIRKHTGIGFWPGGAS